MLVLTVYKNGGSVVHIEVTAVVVKNVLVLGTSDVDVAELDGVTLDGVEVSERLELLGSFVARGAGPGDKGDNPNEFVVVDDVALEVLGGEGGEFGPLLVLLNGGSGAVGL